MPSDFLAALRTLIAAVVVSLYILVAGPPFLIWTVVSGNVRPLYGVANVGVRLAFALAGIRLRVLGREHIRPGVAAVYASNHISNIDPPALFTALSSLHPRLRTVYKTELRRLPVLVWAFDQAGFVPIQRGNRGQSLPAIDRATSALAAGNAFFMFPEGTRSRTGQLLPFKKGGFLMAIGAQVPVVPIVVSGGRDALRKGSAIIRPVTVTIDVGAPIPTVGLTSTDRDALVGRVRAAMDARLPREPL